MSRLAFLMTVLIFAACLLCSGCIKSQAVTQSTPFEEADLDAALAIVIDLSGSYSSMWDDKAYKLFLDISERFFQGAMGTETRLVIGQLSGSDTILLFEGKTADFHKKFRDPQELNEFLKAHSDPSSSRVYEATRRTLDYVGTLPGVGPKTRLLTVIMSDMQDSSVDSQGRGEAEQQLKASLQRYQSRGGALALYYVAESERGHWATLLQDAGFSPGHWTVESDLTSSPQIPRFD